SARVLRFSIMLCSSITGFGKQKICILAARADACCLLASGVFFDVAFCIEADNSHPASLVRWKVALEAN
ncbi:MAG: hypothetical protein ABI614_16565, partial [Planctomycetota bacterium]